MVNKRVLINAGSWTLLTDKTSLIQFNGDAYMYISDVANVPADSVGFTMARGEKYISSTDGIYGKSPYLCTFSNCRRCKAWTSITTFPPCIRSKYWYGMTISAR